MAPPRTCECGNCRKCKWREYMRGWYARNAEKARQSALRSRERRLEQVRAYDRARGATKTYDPFKQKARMAVTHAITAGRLIPQPCEVCGGKGEAHHDDYSQPLDVRWLCRKHHMALHRTVAA